MIAIIQLVAWWRVKQQMAGANGSAIVLDDQPIFESEQLNRVNLKSARSAIIWILQGQDPLHCNVLANPARKVD